MITKAKAVKETLGNMGHSYKTNDAIRGVTLQQVADMQISVEHSQGYSQAHVFMGPTPKAQFSIQFSERIEKRRMTKVLLGMFPFATVKYQN